MVGPLKCPSLCITVRSKSGSQSFLPGDFVLEAVNLTFRTVPEQPLCMLAASSLL